MSALLRISYTWFFGVCDHQHSFPQPQQSGLNVCAVYSHCPEGSGKGIYLLNDVQTARFNRWQLKHSTSDHQWCGFILGSSSFFKKKKVVIIDFFFLLCKLLLVSSWILLLCPLLRTELDFTWANFVLLLLLPSAVACGLCSYEIKSWSLRTDVNKQAWTQTDAFSHPPSFSPVGNLLTSVKFKKEGTHWSGLSFVFLVLFTGGHLWKGKQMEHRLKGQSWVIQPNPLVSAATMSCRSCSWVYQDGSCLTVVLSEEYRPVLIKLNAVQFDLLRGGILFM